MHDLIDTRQSAVRLRAWGATDSDIERAVHAAQQAPSRDRWHIIEIERIQAPTCPLNVRATGGGVIAADAGYGWAYIASIAAEAA